MNDSEQRDGLWELYGLKTNPFSTSPLLVKGGVIPVESFHGRIEELKRLKKIFRSSGGNRILVCGDVGVGKTSFVNVARFRALQEGHFTPFKEIAVRSNWNPNSFIMNTLYAIHSTLKLRNDLVIKKEISNKLADLSELTSVDHKAVGVSVAGFGANIDKNVHQNRAPSDEALMDFAREVIAEIVSKTGKEIILHYNNLERLPEKTLRELFEDLRDFFQNENVHFVFVGNLTVNSVFQSMPRVSSIMSDTPILLNELSLEHIGKIIEIRIEKLRISKDLNCILPYKPEVLETLFDLYGGNIRNILNSLSTAVIEVTNEKPVRLDHNLIARTLKQIVEVRYLGNIPPRAKDVLDEAVKHPEITNKHLSKATGIARPNISTYITQLQSNGCIYLRRKDGKDKYWSVEPRIKWLLLKPKDVDQKDLRDF